MSEKKNIPFVNILLIMALTALIFLIVILCLVPPVSKDALVHHLTVPKLYLKHGGIYEIPFMPFSYFPMNLDLIYMIPLYFGNDIAPKLIHFVFALLTAGLIFYYLKKRTNAAYGLLGAVFFLSIPIIIKLSITAYVDLGEIFFSFASLLLLLKWIRSGFRFRFLLFSGISCGLALGTKYNGLITLILITLFIPFLYSRHSEGESVGFFRPAMNGLIFFLIALIIFSPWMIRNYRWKGNPIYPLHNKLFNPPKGLHRIVTSGNVNKVNRGFFTYRSIIYHEKSWQIALLPIRIFFQGKDGDSQYFDGKLNPFLLLLPFFAFYRTREGPEYLRREKMIILAFVVLFFFFAFFSAVLRIRYISPIIPPLIILSIFGLRNLIDAFRSSGSHTVRWAGRILVVIILTLFFYINAGYLLGQIRYVSPFRYLCGELSRDEYIVEYRPEYPSMKFINDHLGQDAKILFIFLGNRGYYCDREYVFDLNILKNIINRAETSEDVLKGLKRLGFTHLLVYYHLFERWLNENFSPEKVLLTRQFFGEHVKQLFYEKGFGVLSLKQ